MTEARPVAGEIRRDAVYSVKEFCRRTGIGRDRVRKFIKPRHVAGKAYVIGDEFVDLVKSQPKLLPHETGGDFQDTILAIVGESTVRAHSG